MMAEAIKIPWWKFEGLRSDDELVDLFGRMRFIRDGKLYEVDEIAPRPGLARRPAKKDPK
jgi:hypothetical protein